MLGTLGLSCLDLIDFLVAIHCVNTGNLLGLKVHLTDLLEALPKPT